MGFRELLRYPFRPRKGIVLALGGGGARGLAHAGILSVLEELGVPVVGIAGTSAGAVVGAMWLAYGGAAGLEQRWAEFMEAGLLPESLPNTRLTANVTSRDSLILQYARKLRRGAVVALTLNRKSLVEQEELDRAIEFLIPDVEIQSLRLPFVAVATDFHSGELVAIRRGPLRPAVSASSAVPGAIPPYRVGDRVLMDGGVVADIPVETARRLAKRPVVAVDVGDQPGSADIEDLTVPRALMRASVFTHRALVGHLAAHASLVIRPQVEGIHWSEFVRYQEAMEAGKSAARANRNRLRALALRNARRRS